MKKELTRKEIISKVDDIVYQINLQWNSSESQEDLVKMICYVEARLSILLEELANDTVY